MGEAVDRSAAGGRPSSRSSPGNLAYGLYANTSTNHPEAQVYVGGSDAARSTEPPPCRSAAGATSPRPTTGRRCGSIVNGVQVAQLAQAGSILTSNSPLRIGGNAIWGEWFNGLIDEVRVYNRALSRG